MDNSRGVLCFVLGCAVGGVGGVLFAPKARDAIKFLGKKAEAGSDYVKQRVDEAREAVTEVRDSVASVGDAVTGAISKGRRAVRYQAENISSAIDAGEQAYKAAQEATP